MPQKQEPAACLSISPEPTKTLVRATNLSSDDIYRYLRTFFTIGSSDVRTNGTSVSSLATCFSTTTEAFLFLLTISTEDLCECENEFEFNFESLSLME